MILVLNLVVFSVIRFVGGKGSNWFWGKGGGLIVGRREGNESDWCFGVGGDLDRVDSVRK